MSNDQLVKLAYLTISKLPQIKRDVLMFVMRGDKDGIRKGWVDPNWVISELRDIISSGINGMRTIRRLHDLNLSDDDDTLDDVDLITTLKHHLAVREELMEKNKPKELLYEPEINNYVNTNCGLNSQAKNALIIELVLRWKDSQI